MDDTLFDFKRTERINLTETLARFGIDADERVWHRFHEINLKLWQQFELGEVTKEQIKRLRFERLFVEFGFSADVEKVSPYYVNNFNNICIPFDGADGFMRRLSQLGRIYVVTNGNTDCQKRHVTDAGFLPLISKMFISDEIGSAKPSAEFADFVMAHIDGFERERAVWIGDSLTSDKKCAEVAGVDFILYSPSGAPSGYGGAVAKNYGEVLELIK